MTWPSDPRAWAVLTLAGEIDLAESPAVREAVDELIAADRAHLVWDLQAVTFMDSAGLGVLVHAMRAAEARHGGVRLAGAGEQVQRLLELTGLAAVVEMFPDVISATGSVDG
ncbi:STAS domain-containing protein [Streptomyces sp. SID14478]|uniref:anti-sigma factor antagonist n=1 Tax=Streptomyces sp. SID14478 TaxID=2706073 RepID=UPI0013E0D170|nr:STAS domain-containing protein [Streptomyces sp. SID14478]